MIILQKTALNLAGQENSNFGIQLFLVSIGWLRIRWAKSSYKTT